MKLPRKERTPVGRSTRTAQRGFSLVELLVTMSLAAVLAALISAGIQSASKKAKSAQCLAKMRNLGQAVHLSTVDTSEFPRSLHSAAGAGTQPWARSLLPYLGASDTPSSEEWVGLFEKLYRCPADPKKDAHIFSYALNVFFELTPDGDDYVGSPRIWRKPLQITRPGRTILLAEPKPVYYADHVMCHQWTTATGAANAIDAKRHDGRSNYLFVDGHVETLPLSATFDPTKGVNLWNPSLAGDQPRRGAGFSRLQELRHLALHLLQSRRKRVAPTEERNQSSESVIGKFHRSTD